MGIVRFALRFPHTFYVLALLISFLGIMAAVSMPTDIFPGDHAIHCEHLTLRRMRENVKICT